MSDEIIFSVGASAPRRFIGVVMLLGLGALLLYIAFATPPAIYWQAFLVILGLFILYGAQKMWQATEQRLELTDDVLRDSDGSILVRVEDIVAVNRGNFAIKPSNGFMIKTRHPQARAWRPGLWWRMGRMVAVGGVTPGSQTKPMADVIAAMVADRRS